MKKLQNRKGFTLVELLIVMAIIGILIMVAIPRFSRSTDSATLRTVQANARIAASATQTFFADRSAWPDSIAVLVSGGYIPEETFGTNGTSGTKPSGAEYSVTSDSIVAKIALKQDPGAASMDGVSWLASSKQAEITIKFK